MAREEVDFLLESMAAWNRGDRDLGERLLTRMEFIGAGAGRSRR